MIYLGNLFVFMLLFNLILPNFGLSQVSAQGESTRNPFLTLREQRCGSAIKTRKPIGFFYLQGVFIKPDKKIALINGKVVKEGDFIEDKKVASIEKDSVVLEDGGGKLVIRLPQIKGAKTNN